MFLLPFVVMVGAQPLSVKWSGKQFYDNKKEGFFSNYIGSNSKYIYALYANKTKRTKKERLRIVALASENMKELAAVTLVDRRDPAQKEKYLGYIYEKTLVYENRLYIFWSLEKKNNISLFVEVFDDKLNRIKELQKVYSTSADVKSLRYVRPFISGNRLLSRGIMVGADFRVDKESGEEVEYNVLDSALNVAFSGRKKINDEGGKADMFSTVYQYGEDGNLHLESRVYSGRFRNDNYSVYTVISPSADTLKTIPLQIEKKNVFDVGIKAEKNAVKIFGFFCDLTKDPQGEDTHGIFYCLINPVTLQIVQSNFSYFTREQLEKVFSKDKMDWRERRTFYGRGGMYSREESLGSFYEIESVQSVDSTDLVLFCSMMRNVSRVSCDNRGVCNTYYYCNKSNVTAFRISSDGTIVWVSNLNRFQVYEGWNVKDVHVICPDNKTFYVSYGSELLAGKETRSFFSRKSVRHVRDFFEYGVFDYATGAFRKEEIHLNKAGTSRKEMKTIYPLAVQVHNNKFFVHSIQIAPKPWVCATGILFPVYLVLISNGNSYRGAGYLGSVAP